MSTVAKQIGKAVVTPKAPPTRYEYGRPANGGAPVGGKQEGNPPTNSPSGVIPDYSVTTLPNNGGTAGPSGDGLGQ